MPPLLRPSPPPGRPLLELLEEQQEPFLLEVYLLEHGCSKGVLCSEATTMYGWPGNACRRVKRLARHGFHRQRRGILSALLALFVPRRSPWASNWQRKGGHYSDVRKISGSAESDQISCSAREENGEGKAKLDAGQSGEWVCTEEAKQLSPVSVLELHSDGGSPPHGPREDDPLSTSVLSLPAEVLLDILEEFHGSAAATRHVTTKREPYGTKLPLLACVDQEDDERSSGHESELTDQHLHEILGPQRVARVVRCRQLTFTRRTTATASPLMESDVRESRGEWSEFHPDAREIGDEIGDEIFDDLAQDFVSHMSELFSRWKRY